MDDKQAQAALRRAVGILEAVLARQTGLHRSMIAVAEAKRHSVVKGDLEGLERAVADEKRLVAAIEEEEAKRLAVMPMIQRQLGAGGGTLSDLIARLPEPDRGRLAGVREDLRRAIEECRRKTRHNAELLRASLEHVDAFLKSVAAAVSPDANYRPDGKKRAGSAIIDRNA